MKLVYTPAQTQYGCYHTCLHFILLVDIDMALLCDTHPQYKEDKSGPLLLKYREI